MTDSQWAAIRRAFEEGEMWTAVGLRIVDGVERQAAAAERQAEALEGLVLVLQRWTGLTAAKLAVQGDPVPGDVFRTTDESLVEFERLIKEYRKVYGAEPPYDLDLDGLRNLLN